MKERKREGGQRKGGSCWVGAFIKTETKKKQSGNTSEAQNK